ncbi:helix-turn-helix transcriptional regulator [Ekhidna sp. MALMAid0563]|uniref:helix-turn-helix transcriptional regulator n=1 Tax=Ekhidna sp. MALMAid0563 TaxID=3143937 RepID=UPI0032DE4107
MDYNSLLLIFCSSGVIQSLFLSIYIFSSKNIQPGERVLLGSLLLAITLRLVKSIGWYFFDINDDVFLNIGFAAHGFIGALLVIYFAHKSTRLRNIFSRLLILLPGMLLLIATPFLTLSNFWYAGGYQALLYYTIVTTLISAYFLRVIYSERKIYFPWYRNLFLGVSVFCISYFTNYIFGLNPYITGPVVYSIVIYMISFILFSNQEIFTPLGDKKKYKNINLTPDQIDHHRERIEGVMMDQKPYLDSDFSLTALSQLTSIPKHLLSRFFSENMNQSFSDYTNSYRIEKAKELLTNPKYDNHKIAYIAYECGFNSLSSFNTAFRKNVNSSPSEYKKLIMNA